MGMLGGTFLGYGEDAEAGRNFGQGTSGLNAVSRGGFVRERAG